MYRGYATDFLKTFSCLGDKCPDTCCQSWNMQVDVGMQEKYAREAPELLSAIVPDGDGAFLMKRDATTDFCVKLEGGLCGIHKKFGSDFLGDACHFYPRVTRALGETVVMSAAPSCPEALRLALQHENPMALGTEDFSRVPYTLKNYLPAEMNADEALAIHRACVDVALAHPAEEAIVMLSSVARSLDRQPKEAWKGAAPLYIKLAQGRKAATELHAEDPFALLHAFIGLVVAAQKKISLPLTRIIDAMYAELHARVDMPTMNLSIDADAVEAFNHVRAQWKKNYESVSAPWLQRWFALQLSVALFPFAGFGNTLTERITIIGVRMATLKLAWMCVAAHEKNFTLQTAVDVAYVLARRMDHLADPAFSLAAYKEAGWLQEPRLLGISSL